MSKPDKKNKLGSQISSATNDNSTKITEEVIKTKIIRGAITHPWVVSKSLLNKNSITTISNNVKISPLKANKESQETKRSKLKEISKLKENMENETLQQQEQNNFYPKNVNVYRHLLDPKAKWRKTEIKWSIKLRCYENWKKSTNDFWNEDDNDEEEEHQNKRNNRSQIPPKFYEADWEKYKKKRQMKTSQSMRSIYNWNDYSHLLRRKEGTPDIHKLNFETTLRCFEKVKTGFVNNNEWNNHTTLKRASSSYWNPSTTIKDNYIIRPYEEVRDKVVIGNDTIKRRKLVKSKNEACNWLGDHLSLQPFNDRYPNKNYVEIRSYWDNNKTQQDNVFQMSWRNWYVKHLNTGSKAAERKKGKKKLNKSLEMPH